MENKKELKELLIYTVLLVVLMLLISACNDSDTDPITATLEFIGFEDKFTLHMLLVEPYLYECAVSYGMWRRNIQYFASDWQYLGLRDSSLGKYSNVRALDIDILGEDILVVAYNVSAPHVTPKSTVSVWQSTNGGQSWERSDRVIPETIFKHYEHNIITSLQRSPHQPSIVIGWVYPKTYLSSDSRNSWPMISGFRGVFTGDGYVHWHPFRAGEVWIFGSADLFYPYCLGKQNYGLKMKTSVDFDSLGFPSDGAVVDIIFDASNSDIVYATTTSPDVIKSIDGGYTWRNNAIKLPDKGFVSRMVHHPTIGGMVYFTEGKSVYISSNAVNNVSKIAKIERGFIQSFAVEF